MNKHGFEMKRKVTFILCILSWVLLTMFFVQERTRVFKLKPLNGVYYNTPTPVLALQYCLSGKYQNDLENHLRYHFGFREVLIRLYNQYAWDFYHTTTNKTVKVSDDNWLIGKREWANYYESRIAYYASSRAEMKAMFDREAMRMYKVQNILDEYGVFLFVTLLPGKEFVYPEHLPEYQPEDDSLHLEPLHAIQYYPVVFDSLGVNYINVQRIFLDWKDKVDYPLYPQTGAHWSHVASAQAFDTILRYIEHESGMNLNSYQIVNVHPDVTVPPDNDLENVMNLCRPIKQGSNYYSDTKAFYEYMATMPRFLIIGDSYFWNLTQSVPLGDLFSHYEYWYYNSTVYFNPNCNHTSELDILSEILNTQIIDLSYSPVQLYDYSDHFLPKALLYLTHEDAEIEAVIDSLASTMEQTKGEEKRKAAMDLLFSSPEDYFPDLAAEGIPATRNSRIKEVLR